MPVFMPWAPVGGWMCAASPATKTRPSPYRSTIRWLMRNTEAQRMSEAVVGLGESRSRTVWMSASPGARPVCRPWVTPSGVSPARRSVESSGGTIMDMR